MITLIFVVPIWQIQPWYARFLRINGQSNHHTSYANSTAKCLKAGSSISGKQNIKVSGLERESRIDSGLSESGNGLISSARGLSSNSNYNSCWEKLISWCSRKEIDPDHCSVNFTLDFLAERFDLGYKYRSINSYRPAVSAYHCYVEENPVD